MPLQSRIGDLSYGHWIGIFYFPPTPLVTGSPDSYSCCIAKCRVSDVAKPHFSHIFGVVPFPWFIHTPVAATGATETFVNMLPAFCVGDYYSCGDMQAQGCGMVLVADPPGEVYTNYAASGPTNTVVRVSADAPPPPDAPMVFYSI